MIGVDTNILVAAHRSDAENHARALDWVRRLAEGSDPWAIPFPCIPEFVRVTTHRSIFARPSSLNEASAWLDALRGSPSLQVLYPDAGFIDNFLATVKQADARGNLVFDAQIATLCRVYRVTRFLTLDRDFARFRHLQIVDFAKGL